MPKLYVKLASNPTLLVEVSDDCSGIQLRKVLKNGAFKDYAGISLVKLSDIQFDSSHQRKALDPKFYSKYQDFQSPLMVFIKTLARNDKLYEALGEIGILASDLKVSKVLYVRQCYTGIYKAMMNYIDKRKVAQLNLGWPCNIFLTGTPGIGKTAFLLYFIQELLKKKRAVVFGSKTNRDWVHHWDADGKHFTVPWKELNDHRQNPEVFFILDSIDFNTTRGPCLVSTSPIENVGRQHCKNAASFYMPTWNWDEIYNCHQLIYQNLIPDLTVSKLAARFFVLGGVPRLLFDNISESSCEIIDNALDNTTWDQLKQVATLDGAKSADSISHRLIHRTKVNGDYSKYEVHFASQFVAVKVMQNYAQNRRDKVAQFLDEYPLKFPGTLRGNIYENLGHMWFRNGFRKMSKLLVPGGQSIDHLLTIAAKTLKFVSSSINELQTKSEYQTDESKYFQPLSKSFECIDAWVVINGETWGIKFTTVCAAHKISSAVYWFYQNLNMRHYIKVVYDDQKYRDWKYAEVSMSKKKPFVDAKIPPNFDLKQYVVKADIKDYAVADLDPCEGYQSFVPNPNDEQVLHELGLDT